jgi:CubicO group peptidase (beta-lactamase class C family)
MPGEDRYEGGCQTIAPAIAAVFVLLFSSALTGRTARGDERIMQTQAIFSGLILEHEPGAAVLVVKDGGVVFERGYGVTDLRTRRRIDARTNFRLASVSKQFTAAAVMLLVRDGCYEDGLTDIFRSPYGRITSDTFSTTSGLPTTGSVPPEPSLSVDGVQIKDGVSNGAGVRFAPEWAYSNSLRPSADRRKPRAAVSPRFSATGFSRP